MVACPICGKQVREKDINPHIDSDCADFIIVEPSQTQVSTPRNNPLSTFFSAPTLRRSSSQTAPPKNGTPSHPAQTHVLHRQPETAGGTGSKRERDETPPPSIASNEPFSSPTLPKRPKLSALQKVAPLAERMRPKTLDDVCGQSLVGPHGVIRGLIDQDRVPSMILWGGPGTGKTTIARIIASSVGARFEEINSANSGVGEVKKFFTEARRELQLSGRKTIVFCDEIHRFSKSQQDVFLGPVESGLITLIGATTENPSFKVVSALLSRCRTFTLSKLTDEDIVTILERALEAESYSSPLLDEPMMKYLAAFADGDARTGLNLLELAIDLSKRPSVTADSIQQSLTQTLVYDRAGDQHYDTISALHKSIRGSDPDAAVYYLARMLQSGEDPLYIARRLVVVASEDVGVGDNTMLPLAIATHTAVEKIGMPEARIPLAHATVALALAPKSTRAYRALNNAYAALSEPGIAGLPIPPHIRNAPTRLMKNLGYGKDYKYNPDYVDGKVKQEYLPDKLRGRVFLENRDLGTKIDADLKNGHEDTALEDEYEETGLENKSEDTDLKHEYGDAELLPEVDG